MCAFICVTESIARAGFNRMWRKLRQSKHRENLCWHSAATRWPVNANFNNSLIIGVRAPLDHFALCEQATRRREPSRASEIGVLNTEILMKCE